MFTFFLWIIGHFGRDLQSFGAITKSAAAGWICHALYYILPNLANFNFIDSRSVIRTEMMAKTIDPLAVAGSAAYALLYCTAILALSIAIFTRRDLK